MSGRTIDDQIRDHYLAQAPRPEALAHLEQVLAGTAPARPDRRGWAVAAAAAIVAALLAVAWPAVRPASPSSAELAAAVARQAAAGHNEKAELELRAHDFAELRVRMKSLDFAPVEPRTVREMSMRLVGARYAILGGAIAAQIVYLDAYGVPCTLYEARPVDRLANVPAGDHQIDGLEVTVWREKGLLMVLARPLA
jgi:hypothetical protein